MSKSCWFRKSFAACLVVLLSVPFAEAATAPQEVAASTQQPQSTAVPKAQPETPDARTAPAEGDVNVAVNAYPENPAPAAPQATPAQPAQSSSEQQQTPPSKPVGTAAAPYEKPTGVAASRPAGAVIAPAKQKRVRIILIRTAIVVGAAVAVGAVVGLSKGSPSKPN
jgi:hypothetical protein